MTQPADVSRDQDTQMLTALVRMRGALQGAQLPLELDGVEKVRTARQRMIDQLEDYVIPRQMTIEAPLLAIVGGSTGAGKSTLVNSLVGHRVTASGLLRPTTRSPVLVHHPDDAKWFGQDRLLPDLKRVDHSTDDPDALQLVAAETVPAGLAILDAPDVDSVEERNRILAAQLLAAGDLWLFVTSAARYSDQVPWEYLKSAAKRSTAVAIVLDRTPADAIDTVAAHLARMLASRGLKDSPLFTVNESVVSEDGLLAADEVAQIRGWLHSLAADREARAAVVKQTLDGSVRSLARETHAVADAAEAQLVALGRLRQAADAAYDDDTPALLRQSGDGSLLRGEIVTRWQAYAGTGELLRSLEGHVGRLRDRVVNAVRRTPQQAELLNSAVESGLELLVLDHAESAADHARASWQSLDGGAALLEEHPEIGRPASDLRRRAEADVRAWQLDVLELIRSEGADKRASAKFLAYGVNGLGAALMIVVLVRDLDDTDGSVALGRQLLDAIFGETVVESMVATAGSRLEERLQALLDGERRRYLGVLDDIDQVTDAHEQLRAASRRVDDRRFEQTR